MRLAFSLAVLLCVQDRAQAYSVLTHEAIIDSVWESHLQPALLRRFPDATPEELHKAHAYVYGGSLIQDMGYAPFSSRFFSDLTHYVRSGDFVEALIGDSQTLNEYAFALGSLAHYSSDSTGHPTINRITPLVYPKVRAKHGPVATYEDDPAAHLKTEFALDVLQVARGVYASEDYHDFVGFEIEQAGLERAFAKTYGIPLKDLFLSEDMAIGIFRFSVGSLVPKMTRVAWETKKDDIEKAKPGITRSKYLYTLSRKQYEREWGKQYRGPGVAARILAWVFRVLPKVGPLKTLAFQPIPPSGEKMFLEAFDVTVDQYRRYLTEERAGRLNLSDDNLDTGQRARATQYNLADKAYNTLLDKLSSRHFESVTPELRANILAFFDQMSPDSTSPKAISQLQQLRGLK